MRSEEYKRLIRTRRWRKLRLAYLKGHPLCEKCSAAGKTVPATEVHHIIPVSNERDTARMEMLAFDSGNLQALCSECHQQVHEDMGSRGKKQTRRKAEQEAESFVRRFTVKVKSPG